MKDIRFLLKTHYTDSRALVIALMTIKTLRRFHMPLAMLKNFVLY